MGNLYDVIIIGGGPAGVAAGVYIARKELKTLLITENFNGQSFVSADIQNWIGEAHISGVDLAKKLEEHLRSYPIVEIKTNDRVCKVRSMNCSSGERICDFEVETIKGEKFLAKAVILTSGARRRRLGIPGEDKYDGKGVSFCSTCDAPLFRDKSVAVVGGGNAGLEAVHDLLNFAKEIYLLDSSEKLAGDPTWIDEVKTHPQLKEIILNAQILEILGDNLVSGLKYKDKLSGVERTLEVQGVFVEVGSVPNSEIVKNLVQLDEHNQVIVNFAHSRTSHPGVFAAGDVTNDPYKQNNIAVGDGVRAALACYAYLQGKEKVSPASEKIPPNDK